MTTVLQISDTHIVPKGRLVSAKLDTIASLERLVARIEQIRAQIDPVDAILVSGDLSDDGSAESYALFRSILAPLDLPLFVIPGNHDQRENLREAFVVDGYLPTSGKLNWHRKVGEIDLIGLDTLIEGQGGGLLDAPTLDFLRDALRAAAQRPVLLAVHHHPFPSGIGFMDDIGLLGSKELADLLEGHSAEIRVVCGHIHNTMIATVGGKVALSAPSPCSSFPFDTRRDTHAGFTPQEDGFLLHRWQSGFQSVRVSVESASGPFPF